MLQPRSEIYIGGSTSDKLQAAQKSLPQPPLEIVVTIPCAMSTLTSVLDNTAVPVAPLVVVLDSLSAPAQPLARELLSRGKRR